MAPQPGNGSFTFGTGGHSFHSNTQMKAERLSERGSALVA